MVPYAVISDHSLERGGSKSEEYIEAAKAQNVGRLCLFDYDAMSSVVTFIKNAKKSNVKPIIGVYLPVYLPQFTPYTATLISRNTRKLLTNNFRWLDNLSLPQSIELVSASVVYLKSKAKLKAKIFIDKMAVIGINITEHDVECLVQAASKQKKWIDDPVSVVRVGFIAKTSVGYKSLLRLSSEVAINEQSVKLGKVEDSIENRAVSLEQISKNAVGVVVLDPLLDDSLLGKFIGYGLPIDAVITDAINSLNLIVGVTQIVKKSTLNYAAQLNCRNIPFPIAQFAESYHYEEFCVKHAALSKSSMSRLQYKAPVDKDAHIWDQVRLDAYYANASKSINLDLSFWDGVEDTDVAMDKVMLPNCAIPEREVAEYACNLKGVSFLNPVMTFDGIIKDGCPENKAFMDYRRQQYEALYMHKLGWEGVLLKCVGKIGDPEAYKVLQERFDMEYAVIDGMGFAGYFLIMEDIISYARKIGVPVGAGRGSAAGSLIVYGLDITDVDPIDYGLQFERFLNPERVSMPDIDVDFGTNGDVGREDVIKYINEKYGNDEFPFTSVSQIANINRFGLKNSFDFACEAYGLPAYYKKYIKGLIEKAEVDLSIKAPANIDFDELVSHDGFAAKLRQEPMLYKITQRARGLFGKKQTNGVHAGGVVIAPTMIPDYSALGCSAKGNLVSQFDKDDIETAGLVKLDILGLMNLTVLCETNRNIIKTNGTPIDFRSINREDPDVFAMINQGLTKGLFQIESQGMQSLIRDLQPESIEELGALSALFRPGALQSGMVEDYIQTKHGLKPLTFDHPAIQDATKETYGCIVYQEQVMSILRLLAGYTLGEADQVRRAMGKKKMSEMVRHKSIFIARSLKFWRDDNVSKGKPLFSDFNLDVILDDLATRAPALSLEDVLEDGVFASPANTMLYMKVLLGLTQENFEKLELRLNDISYTVTLFKQHYQDAIYLSVQQRLLHKDPALITEAKVRMYYAMSQWVRFHWVFNKIEKFAGYGFNKSHAIGYSFTTYETSYSKYHYPPQFYAACLTHCSLDGLDEFAKEAHQYKKIRILKTDINKSGVNFEVEDERSIRYGMAKLRGVKGSAASIIDTREKVDGFKTVWHFVQSFFEHTGQNVSSDVVVALAMTGGFDDFIPVTVKISKQINGRQFMKEIVNHSRSHPLSDFTEMNDIMDMKDYDINKLCAVWCLTMQKKGFDAYRKSKTETNLNDQLPVLSKILDMGKRAKAKIDIVAVFEQTLNIILADRDVFKFVISWMKESVGMSLVDSVNEEKRLSGMYMTTNPLKAVNAYHKVDCEPPGAHSDGCPVYIADIDGDYDGEMVTTVGLVKNIEERTITNPESTMFNQKILSFVLEDGMNTINVAIIGTRATLYMKKLLIENTIMMAIGRIRNHERFGLSLALEVCKRYHPEEDETFIRVPRLKPGGVSLKTA